MRESGLSLRYSSSGSCAVGVDVVFADWIPVPSIKLKLVNMVGAVWRDDLSLSDNEVSPSSDAKENDALIQTDRLLGEKDILLFSNLFVSIRSSELSLRISRVDANLDLMFEVSEYIEVDANASKLDKATAIIGSVVQWRASELLPLDSIKSCPEQNISSTRIMHESLLIIDSMIQCKKKIHHSNTKRYSVT